MSRIGNLTVLLSLCAVLSTIFADEMCTYVLFGQKSKNQSGMPRVTFTSGNKIQNMRITSGCETVGLGVTVCDDVAPDIFVKNLTLVVVERAGSLDFPGYADVVPYCPT